MEKAFGQQSASTLLAQYNRVPIRSNLALYLPSSASDQPLASTSSLPSAPSVLQQSTSIPIYQSSSLDQDTVVEAEEEPEQEESSIGPSRTPRKRASLGERSHTAINRPTVSLTALPEDTASAIKKKALPLSKEDMYEIQPGAGKAKLFKCKFAGCTKVSSRSWNATTHLLVHDL